jgi:hypothetical protein
MMPGCPARGLTMLAGIAFATLGPAAMAGPWDGLYHPAGEASCADEASTIRIEAGMFHGVGMSCEITQPVNVLDMEATLYTMECANDAEAWSERAMILQDAQADGIFMIWNGYVFRYGRCPAAEPDLQGTTAEDSAP